MGRSRVDEPNQIVEEMAEAARESYRAVADSAVGFQERNVLFFESLFEAWNETLREQAKTNHTTTQALVEQTHRQWEAYRKMVQESMEAYIEFLDSLFPYSQATR